VKDEATIALPGLSNLELAELKKALPSGAYKTESKSVPPGAFGEPVLASLLIVTLTSAALQALVAYWATKNRGKRFKETFYSVAQDGTLVERTIEIQDTTGEKLETQVYNKLATVPELGSVIKSLPGMT
jgi:hypothetical protein